MVVFMIQYLFSSTDTGIVLWADFMYESGLNRSKISLTIFVVSISFIGLLFVLDIIVDSTQTFQKTLCEENEGIWENMLLGGRCVMGSFECREAGGTPECGDGVGLSCYELCEFWMYDYNPP